VLEVRVSVSCLDCVLDQSSRISLWPDDPCMGVGAYQCELFSISLIDRQFDGGRNGSDRSWTS